jgi:hypothetical protein
MPIYIDYKFQHHFDIENSSNPQVDEIFGEIYLDEYREKEPIKIGVVELHFYNHLFSNYGFEIYEAFDRSVNTIKLGGAILEFNSSYLKDSIVKKIGDSYNYNILVIHELILFSEYRKKGHGKEILSGIETFFGGKCGYIALQSFPKQHEAKFENERDPYMLSNMDGNYVNSQKSLNSFYEKCGYTKVFGSGNCFIKNVQPCE